MTKTTKTSARDSRALDRSVLRGVDLPPTETGDLRAYSVPRLLVHGTLTELVQSGFAGDPDSFAPGSLV